MSNAWAEILIGMTLLTAAALHVWLWPKVDRLLLRKVFPRSDRFDGLSDTQNLISTVVAAVLGILFLVGGIEDLH
jgi:hypothetical protein